MKKNQTQSTDKSYKLDDLRFTGIKMNTFISNPKIELWIKVNYFIVNFYYQKGYEAKFFMSNKFIAKLFNQIGLETLDEETGVITLNHDWCTPKGIESSLRTLTHELYIIDNDGNRKDFPLLSIYINPQKKSESIDPDNWHHRTITLNERNQFMLINEFDRTVYRAKHRFKKLIRKHLFFTAQGIKEAYKRFVSRLANNQRIKSSNQFFIQFLKNMQKEIFGTHANLYLVKLEGKQTTALLSDKEAQEQEAERQAERWILEAAADSPNVQRVSSEQSKALDEIYKLVNN